MDCKHCGAKAEEGLVYCPSCGKKLVEREYTWKHRVLAVLGIVAVIAVNVYILIYIGTRG